MLHHVKEMLKEHTGKDDDLKDITNKDKLVVQFNEHYTKDSFFAVQDYIDGRFNYDKSYPLAKYFYQTIFCNLAAQTKKYMDNTAQGRSNRTFLLRFYDRAASANEFINLRKDYFFILEDKVASARNQAPDNNATETNKRFKKAFKVRRDPPPSD